MRRRWHAACRFARELNLAKIARTIGSTTAASVASDSTRARTRTGLRSSLRLLTGRRRQFETSDFSLPGVNSSSHVHVALRALRLSRLLDKAPIRILADFDRVAELADFHAVVLDQSRDLTPGLVGVLGHQLSADVDV
jgi:hypothetical protein